MSVPHRGMIFRHARYLDPDHSGHSLPCKVTKIAQGVVYYRPLYGYHDDGTEWLGSPSYVAVADFHRIVKDGAA